LKQQGDGAGETSRTTNYELHARGRATRAPVAQTLQSVRQTSPGTTATWLYLFVWFPSIGILNFLLQTNPYQPGEQQVETPT